MPTHREYLNMPIDTILTLIDEELHPKRTYAIDRIDRSDLERMHIMTCHYVAKCARELMESELIDVEIIDAVVNKSRPVILLGVQCAKDVPKKGIDNVSEQV